MAVEKAGEVDVTTSKSCRNLQQKVEKLGVGRRPALCCLVIAGGHFVSTSPVRTLVQGSRQRPDYRSDDAEARPATFGFDDNSRL